jgi:hypothetical protein
LATTAPAAVGVNDAVEVIREALPDKPVFSPAVADALLEPVSLLAEIWYGPDPAEASGAVDASDETEKG